MKRRAGIFSRDVKIRLAGSIETRKPKPRSFICNRPDAKAEAFRQHIEALPHLHDPSSRFFVGQESRERGGIFQRHAQRRASAFSSIGW